MIEEQKLAQAEYAIKQLAESLGMTEGQIVEILKEGMESLSLIAGQLSKTNKYFIDEMEATFN